MKPLSEWLDGISVAEFFDSVAEEIHRERSSEFSDFCEVPLVFCLKMVDTDRVWTVQVDAKRIEIEEDEMIDFPVFTLQGREENWPLIRGPISELLDILDKRKNTFRGKGKWTKSIHKAFESFDGTIRLTLTGKSLQRPVEMRVILNNYEDSEFRSFGVSVPLDILFQVARGEIDPKRASKELRIEGDMGFAMELGGFFVKHFER